MKMRIMQTNALQGLLYEFGIVLLEGHRILLQRVKVEMSQAQDRLPCVITESVLEQLAPVDRLQEDIDQIDKRLWRWASKTSRCWPCKPFLGLVGTTLSLPKIFVRL